MKKIIVYIIFLFTFVTFVKAADAPEPDRVWLELNFELCNKDATKCSVAKNAKGADRRVKLLVQTTDKNGAIPVDQRLQVSSDTYIFECLATNLGEVCTSGNKDIDMKFYGEDRVQVLSNLFATDASVPTNACGKNYIFEGMFSNKDGKSLTQPIKSNEVGILDPAIEWQSCFPYSNVKYLALNLVPPVPRAKNYAGNLGGQQQAQIEFEKPKPTPLPTVPPAPPGAAAPPPPCDPTTDPRKCEPRERDEGKDPFGRIFDAQTLEPVPNIKIVLTKQRLNGSFTKVNPYDPQDVTGGAIINPYTTKNDGMYYFVIPDGTYQIDMSPENNPVVVVATNAASLNPNYNKIYYDIYPLLTGKNIIQKGEIQHRDIPVILPQNVRYLPELESYFHSINKKTGVVDISGSISIPLSQIRIYAVGLDPKTKQGVKGRIIASATAEPNSHFALSFSTSSLINGETYGEIEIEKTDIANASLKLTGEIKKTQLNPILNYIEGYAKDAKGKTIPFAKVGIYQPLGKKPYFETTADDRGYYGISSEHLPPSNYSLKYTTPEGSVLAVSTLDVALGNNNIDMNTFKHVDNIVKPPTDENTSKISNIMSKNGEARSPDKSQTLFVAVIILVLLGAGITVTVFILKKKNNPYVPPTSSSIS